MRDAGHVTVTKAIPQILQAALFRPELRLDSKRGIRAAAERVLLDSGYLPREVYDGRDRRRDSVQRADALTTAFARELEDIIKEVFEVEYPELRAREFMPERTVNPAALTFTYRMTNRLGEADIIDENGSNIPKVDVDAEEWQQPIVTIGASYDFTVLDQMRGGLLGISIDSLKAEAARWAVEYKTEQLAASGDATTGLVGLWNAPGVSATTQVSTGSWISQIATIGTATTTNATPPATVVAQAISADVGAMVATIYANTEGIHEPDTMLIPASVYQKLKTTPMNLPFGSKSLLQHLQELVDLDIEMWPQLNSADAAGHNGVHGVVVVYKKDPKILNLMSAMPFTQLPPQPVKLAYEVNTYARTGAGQVRYPKAVTYMVGLG